MAGGKEISLLSVVGIFGANASGKSNMLQAVLAMRSAVVDSVAEWARLDGIPREPFALDPAARQETTLFEVDVLLGPRGVRYTYGFELSDERVEAEWLHAYPEGHKQVWFDRQADREDGDEFRFPNSNLREGKRLTELTRPNALLLTVGASFNHKQLGAVHRWFLEDLRLVTSDRDVRSRSAHTRDRLIDGRYREQIEALLVAADLGIVGLAIDSSLPREKRVRLLHRTREGAPVPLDFLSQESLGTHAWFAFLGPALDVLASGAVLLADELDASLHPLLAAELIGMFQDPEANPNRAQLLFTTHDATLLGTAAAGRPLGREQVRVTAKRATGETELYPLTDAHPRRDENLERGYLRGRYGGVPRVMTGEVAREVAQLRAVDD
ncbi:ATP/GTP-binding protein [Nocardia sp. NPDC057227]|uniref:AAA family ATPase n=1 Tax=Nocardia sp. NPDC057227 TaxID=3346056 RepID=UPI00362CB17C